MTGRIRNLHGWDPDASYPECNCINLKVCKFVCDVFVKKNKKNNCKNFTNNVKNVSPRGKIKIIELIS